MWNLWKTRILTFLMSILFLTVYSRGLFELFFDKKTAYLIQLSGVFLCLTIFILLSKFTFKEYNRVNLIFLSAFLITVAVSSIITISKFNFISETLLFSGVIFFLYLIFIIMSMLKTDNDDFIKMIPYALFIAGLILFITAVFEQQNMLKFKIIEKYSNYKFYDYILPGGAHNIDFNYVIRPASLTGSMLHYPIIMPIIGVITIRFIKNNIIKALGWVFLLVPFIAFSRSGIVISASVIILYALLRFVIFIKNIKLKKVNWNNLRIFFVIMITVLLISSILILSSKQLSSYIFAILTKIFAFKDIGNTGRYNVWDSLIKSYLKTNLFLGEYAGAATNTAKNILGHNNLSQISPVGIPESGFLQILVSFGAIGIITYYGPLLFGAAKTFFYRKERFLSFVLIGAIIQTLFYQSTEVLPYIFTISLIPFLANNATKYSDLTPNYNKSH